MTERSSVTGRKLPAGSPPPEQEAQCSMASSLASWACEGRYSQKVYSDQLTGISTPRGAGEEGAAAPVCFQSQAGSPRPGPLLRSAAETLPPLTRAGRLNHLWGLIHSIQGSILINPPRLLLGPRGARHKTSEIWQVAFVFGVLTLARDFRRGDKTNKV